MFFSGENDLQSLASRVHPVFGIVFTIVLYLAIGPFYAIPRSGNVSFEIGIKPFLSHDAGPVALTVFTILFFTVTCLLSLNPTKIIDIVGKNFDSYQIDCYWDARSCDFYSSNWKNSSAY